MFLKKYDILSSYTSVAKKTKSVLAQRGYKQNKVSPEVKECVDQIRFPVLSNGNVRRIADKFRESLEDALAGKESSLKCMNTFVQDYPEGNERGNFLALDINSSNLRSMLTKIGDGGVTQTVMVAEISEHYKKTGGLELLGCFASTTKKYLNDLHGSNDKNKEYLAVVSVCFPLDQKALDQGYVRRLFKDFDDSKIVGKELGALLNHSFSKAGVQLKLLGILNDTVGTFISSKWLNPDAAGGIVIGAETNACYVENSENVKDFTSSKPTVVINTEMGCFGDRGELDFIKTPSDINMDSNSSNPGKQTMDKMVSGFYLGEATRQVLHDMSLKNMLCSHELCQILETPFSFPTTIIPKLQEEEIAGNCILCKPIKKFYRQKSTLEMLKDELYGKASPTQNNIKLQDFHVINEVCKAVTERGAHLLGIVIGCLAQRIDQKRVVFGIDGSLYNSMLAYKKIIPDVIKTVAPDKEVELCHEVDGSIRGAAYFAAARKRALDNENP